MSMTKAVIRGKFCSIAQLPLIPLFNMNHPLDAHAALPAKRKRTLNPKLTSEDNVHEDAVKRRKAQQLTTQQRRTPGTSKEKVQSRASTPPPSVVDLDDDANTEMADEESSDSDSSDNVDDGVEVAIEIEDIGLQEETDEQELGQLETCTLDDVG
jgi:hypothetical protein